MLKSLLGKRLRQEVGIPLVTAPVAKPETIVSAPPKKKRRRFGRTELFLVVVILIVGTILAEFNGVVDFGVTRGLSQVFGWTATVAGGGTSATAREEYPHSEPVNESISASQSIPVGSVGEIVSVPGFEYDADALLDYYLKVVSRVWDIRNRADMPTAETPFLRLTVFHSQATEEMVKDNPRLGLLYEQELRADVPIHIWINAWAALGNQSGDLLVMNDRIAFRLLIAMQDYFEISNEDRGGFDWYQTVIQRPIVTAYRP